MYRFSPVNCGSCPEQSITNRRMFFQRSPVSGTKQRLCRQNESSRATGDSFGADEFSDGHAITYLAALTRSAFFLRGGRGEMNKGRVGLLKRTSFQMKASSRRWSS
jgi:hypothetical protein